MEHDIDTDRGTAVAWTVMGEDIQALDRIRSSLAENNDDNTKYQVTVKVLETSKGIGRQFVLFASDVSLRWLSCQRGHDAKPLVCYFGNWGLVE